jgi:hypothetical protein
MSDTFPLICHGASRKTRGFRALADQNRPLPIRSLVSSYKISNRLILRIFHLPIISCPWRTMYLNEDLREEAGAGGFNARVLAREGRMQPKNNQKTNLVIPTPARSVPLESVIYGSNLSRKSFVIKYGGMKRYGAGMSEVWKRYEAPS